MHIIVNLPKANDEVILITDAAARDVRLNSIPSEMKKVELIKAVAAAFISALDHIPDGSAGREKALARTAIQEAAMWAVAAATKHSS